MISRVFNSLAFSLCGTLLMSCDTTPSGQSLSMPVEAPTALKPTMGQSLPPTRAYLLWENGVIPAGRSVEGYELCTMTIPLNYPECTVALENYFVLEELTSKSTYYWTVRARFDDGSVSSYSAVQTFSTQADPPWKIR